MGLEEGYVQKASLILMGAVFLPPPLDAVIHMQQSPRHKRFFSMMQLTLHANRRTPRGTSRLLQSMSAWSVKTRRVPSRHCRDARVYGHTTTAMHDMGTPPVSSPPLFPAARILCVLITRLQMTALYKIVQDDHPPLPDGTSAALRDFLLQCFKKQAQV